MQGNQPFLWTFTAVFPDTRQLGMLEDKLSQDWTKLFWLNTDFTRSLFDETQFDCASLFTAHDPEELVARQLGCQAVLMAIPLHYTNALIDLWAAVQRTWADGFSSMLGISPPAYAANVIDVEAREVPEEVSPG